MLNFKTINNDLKINPALEKQKIVNFLQKTLKEQKKKKVTIGISGGIDSATSLYLLRDAADPQSIFVAHLYYFDSQINLLKPLLEKMNIPQRNIFNISIKTAVDDLGRTLNLSNKDTLRLGNIMARVRMIMLYDLAKKNDALVVGTEDKSEFLLGYFTRFGDAASDIELIRHLYKTQVNTLAKYLGVPKEIIGQKPSPNLWSGQTAENELGFSYEEADAVLYLYHDKKISLEEIKKMNLTNAEKIINRVLKNSFKHSSPYVIK